MKKILGNLPKAEEKSSEVAVISEKERLHRRRSSMLDNRKYRYIIDQRNGIIHDRDCDYQKRIPDSAFDMLEDIEPESNVCRACREAAYIRHAVGNDGKRIGWYKNFFRRVNASLKSIHTLCLENQAKLFMEDLDTLCVKVNEDRWKIRINTGIDVTLYHNNYVLLEDGSRLFVDGYHEQMSGAYYHALSMIFNYTWDKHLKGQEEKKKKELLEQTIMELDTIFFH